MERLTAPRLRCPNCGDLMSYAVVLSAQSSLKKPRVSRGLLYCRAMKDPVDCRMTARYADPKLLRVGTRCFLVLRQELSTRGSVHVGDIDGRFT